MTSQQRELLLPLLLALASVKTIEQVETLWSAIESACRVAGVSLGAKPTSVPQARSQAQALRKRLLG